MKRLNNVIVLVVGIIIGMVIVGVPVMAISYIPSKDVSYKTDYNANVTNVEEALDILTNQVKEINNAGNSLESDILSGKTAYVNGNKLTGSMANYSGQHICINSTNGTFVTNGNYTYTDGETTNEMVTFYSNRNGYFDSNTKFIFGKKSDLARAIKVGSSYLGVDGSYTSDATADATNILSGKTAYVNGNKITGSMANYGGATKAASSITESGTNALVTIPSGYYDTNSKISVPIDSIKQNIKSINSSIVMSGRVYMDASCRTVNPSNMTFTIPFDCSINLVTNWSEFHTEDAYYVNIGGTNYNVGVNRNITVNATKGQTISFFTGSGYGGHANYGTYTYTLTLR